MYISSVATVRLDNAAPTNRYHRRRMRLFKRNLQSKGDSDMFDTILPALAVPLSFLLQNLTPL